MSDDIFSDIANIPQTISDWLADNPIAQAEVKTLVVDMSRFAPYTKAQAEKDRHTWKPVAITNYSDGTHNLHYIGARHTGAANSPNFNPNNATFKTIEEAFKRYDIKAVVVETLNEKSVIGESKFAKEMAEKYGVPVVYAEPPDMNELKVLKDAGYSAKDMMGYYVMRVIPQLCEKKDFAAATNEYLQNDPSFKDIPEGERLKNFDEFKEWYAKNNDSGKNFEKTNSWDVADIADGNFTQRISAVLAKPREEYVDNNITNALNKYGNVLVVYGAGHSVESQPVFEKMFDSKGVTEVLVSQEPPTKNEQQGHGLANGVSGGGRCR